MERWGTGAAPSGRTCLLAPSILTAGGQAEGELGKERAFFLAEQRALHLHFAPGLQGLAKEWIPGWGHRRDWALEQTN